MTGSYQYGSTESSESLGDNGCASPTTECVELCNAAVRPVTEEKHFFSRPSTHRLILGLGMVVTALYIISSGSNSDKGDYYVYSKSDSQFDDDVEVFKPENIPRFFDQKVDHFDPNNTDTWKHRFYAQVKHFHGPGHPIFLVVGGEDGNDDGFFSAFIEEQLAKKYGAFVVQPEHRFYGISQPVDPAVATTEDLKKLLTAKQAIADMLTIVQYYQDQFGCAKDKSHPDYCPVMAVGGSYPGFLAAIMRLHYPHIVDIGYASSAPLKLYSMEADQFAYMEVVTRTADQASPGCAQQVRSALDQVDHDLRAARHGEHVTIAHEKLNICRDTLPEYIQSGAILSEELMMVVSNAFADMNMFNYPPTKETRLARACDDIFQDKSLDAYQKLAKFWSNDDYVDDVDDSLSCFDMTSQLPTGRNPTISGSDWSGIGDGHDGEMFDFHCCTTLTPPVGFSEQSMFPYRPWTLEWLTDHCMQRFNVVPDPYRLTREFQFNDLVGQGATRIIFTNGMNDLWHKGCHLESLSKDLPVINMENGAHHSDLTYSDDMGMDTKDVTEAHAQITNILTGWLNDIKGKELW